MADLQDDEYEIPLRDQRYFGSGLKRKRVQFVPSIANAEASTPSLPPTPSQSAGEAYRSIVLGSKKKAESTLSQLRTKRTEEDPVHIQEDGSTPETDREADTEETRPPKPFCDICNRPITDPTTHSSSIPHQIALQHSHPPSHIDRRRKGLAVLETQGWDPDSRRGLGTEGEGILHPLKARENPARAGLGISPEVVRARPVVKAGTLDAGKVRSREAEGRRKAEKLREQFYRSEDMERYLGEEGEGDEKLDLEAFRRAKRGLLRNIRE